MRRILLARYRALAGQLLEAIIYIYTHADSIVFEMDNMASGELQELKDILMSTFIETESALGGYLYEPLNIYMPEETITGAVAGGKIQDPESILLNTMIVSGYKGAPFTDNQWSSAIGSIDELRLAAVRIAEAVRRLGYGSVDYLDLGNARTALAHDRLGHLFVDGLNIGSGKLALAHDRIGLIRGYEVNKANGRIALAHDRIGNLKIGVSTIAGAYTYGIVYTAAMSMERLLSKGNSRAALGVRSLCYLLASMCDMAMSVTAKAVRTSGCQVEMFNNMVQPVTADTVKSSGCILFPMSNKSASLLDNSASLYMHSLIQGLNKANPSTQVPENIMMLHESEELWTYCIAEAKCQALEEKLMIAINEQQDVASAFNQEPESILLHELNRSLDCAGSRIWECPVMTDAGLLIRQVYSMTLTDEGLEVE